MARARKRERRPGPVVAAVRVWPRALVIGVVAVLLYGAGVSGPFAFDDAMTVVQNPQLRDLGNLHAVLAPMAHTALAGRPLVSLSFALNYALGGLDVTGYHVVNIALHAICALLIFGLVRGTLARLGDRADRARDVNVAFAIALLWTVHPLTSEVVDYLTQRTESMMALGLLLTMYAAMRSLDSPGAKWPMIATVACLAGAASKETIVVAPLLVVLYDRAFAFDSFTASLRARWKLYGGLATSWILTAALVAGNGQTINAGSETALTSPWTYLLNQTVMITRYLRLAIWPQDLVLYYGWPQPLTLIDVWPYAMLIVALFIAAVVAWGRRPALGFLGAWFFLLLAPTSSVLPIATEVGAERRMYLPLVAIITLMVFGAMVLWQRLQPSTKAKSASAWQNASLGSAAVLIVAAILATGTAIRTREYQSPLTMAETVLARWPTASAHNLVGTELVAAGRHDEAIQHFRVAADEFPAARYHLGSELLASGHADEGIAMLERFAKEEPHQVASRSAWIAIGREYEARQNWPRAIESFRHILSIDPSDADAHGLVGEALAGQGEFPEAIPHYQVYLRTHPADASAWSALGVAVIQCGQTDDAVAAFRNAVGAEPGNPHFRENLARSLLEKGDAHEAAEQAKQATRLDPNDPAAHEVLGQALAKEGQIDAAREQFKRALEIDPTFEPAREAVKALGRAGSF